MKFETGVRSVLALAKRLFCVESIEFISMNELGLRLRLSLVEQTDHFFFGR